MSVADSPSLNAEQVDAWRRNIRDVTCAGYCLAMGVAVHQQGEPRQALAFFQQGLAYSAYRDEIEVALADALRAVGDEAEADRALAAVIARSPQAELRGRAGLCRIYASTPVIDQAVTLIRFDEALSLARKLGATEDELALSLRRLAFRLRTRSEPEAETAVRQLLSCDVAALNQVDGGAEALAELVCEFGTLPVPLLPATQFEAWRMLLQLAAATAPANRPSLAVINSQLNAISGDPALTARIPELAALALSMTDDNEAARGFLLALGNFAFHICHDFATAADIFLRLLESNPNDPDIRLQAARSLAFTDRPGEAMMYLRKAASQAPTPAQAGEIAFTMLALGYADEAAAIATNATETYPAELMPKLANGIILQAQGLDNEAMAAATSMRASHPAEVGVLVFYVTQLLVSRQVQAALQALEGKGGQPPTPYEMFWKGLLLAHVGDTGQGLPMVRQVVERFGLASFRLHVRTFPRLLPMLRKELEACQLIDRQAAG